MDRQALIADLIADEGLRLCVYDAATGQPVRSGYLMKGHPTIGVGRALDVHGSDWLLNNHIDAIARELAVRLPGYLELDDARQRVLCNMAFNLGVSGGPAAIS